MELPLTSLAPHDEIKMKFWRSARKFFCSSSNRTRANPITCLQEMKNPISVNLITSINQRNDTGLIQCFCAQLYNTCVL